MLVEWISASITIIDHWDSTGTIPLLPPLSILKTLHSQLSQQQTWWLFWRYDPSLIPYGSEPLIVILFSIECCCTCLFKVKVDKRRLQVLYTFYTLQFSCICGSFMRGICFHHVKGPILLESSLPFLNLKDFSEESKTGYNYRKLVFKNYASSKFLDHLEFTMIYS